jgi:hypothetical protein
VTTPAAVWLVVGLGATALLIIFSVALIRQGILVGRTAMRFAREAGEVSEGIAAPGRAREPRR